MSRCQVPSGVGPGRKFLDLGPAYGLNEPRAARSSPTGRAPLGPIAPVHRRGARMEPSVRRAILGCRPQKSPCPPRNEANPSLTLCTNSPRGRLATGPTTCTTRRAAGRLQAGCLYYPSAALGNDYAHTSDGDGWNHRGQDRMRTDQGLTNAISKRNGEDRHMGQGWREVPASELSDLGQCKRLLPVYS